MNENKIDYSKTREMLPAKSSINYKTANIEGLDIFYREAGDKSKPTLLLLHGFPTSSFMFRNLIPLLAGHFHIIAPDYPGFGQSSAPEADQFNYTFENLSNVIMKLMEALGINKFSIYVQDYGAPVGFRIAVKHPEKVESVIIQNGNAYENGLTELASPLREYGTKGGEEIKAELLKLMSLEGTKFQYLHGANDPTSVSPDTWTLDQSLLEREGNKDIQLALFKDYISNIRQYETWHNFFRTHQPRTLVVWGKNDPFFSTDGVENGYLKDLKNIEVHYFNGGHFVLEEYYEEIGKLMIDFLAGNENNR